MDTQESGGCSAPHVLLSSPSMGLALSPYSPDGTSEQLWEQGCEVPEEWPPGPLNAKGRENHKHIPNPTTADPSRAARGRAVLAGP